MLSRQNQIDTAKFQQKNSRDRYSRTNEKDFLLYRGNIRLDQIRYFIPINIHHLFIILFIEKGT